MYADTKKIEVATKQIQQQLDILFVSDKQINFNCFSSTIRHDLRTPINTILGYADILLEECEQLNKANRLYYHIEAILNHGRQLLRQLDSLLQLIIPSTFDTKTPPCLLDNHQLSTKNKTTHTDKKITKHLLIIDDNKSNRDLLSRQLSRYDYKLSLANSGLKALKLLKTTKSPIELILLDLVMPGMSGYDVLAQLKNNKIWADIPVLIISALDEIDSVVRCMEMGAQDYIQKPFNPIIYIPKFMFT